MFYWLIKKIDSFINVCLYYYVSWVSQAPNCFVDVLSHRLGHVKWSQVRMYLFVWFIVLELEVSGRNPQEDQPLNLPCYIMHN